MAYAFQVLLENGETGAIIKLKPRLHKHTAAADAWEICQGLKERFPVKGFRMLRRGNGCVKFRPDGREFMLR